MRTSPFYIDRKRATVRNGKGGKTRIVPVMEEEPLGDLRYLIGKRTSGYVFASTQGNGGKELTPRQADHYMDFC